MKRRIVGIVGGGNKLRVYRLRGIGTGLGIGSGGLGWVWACAGAVIVASEVGYSWMVQAPLDRLCWYRQETASGARKQTISGAPA